MSAFDIVKNAAIIFFGVAAIAGGLYFGISYLVEKQQSKVNATEEIFLDERYYDEFDLSAAEKVNLDEVDAIFSEAMKLEKDEEGHTLKFTFPDTIGNTAAAQQFTDDLDVNQTLSEIIAKVVDDFKRCLPEATIYVYDNNTEPATIATNDFTIVSAHDNAPVSILEHGYCSVSGNRIVYVGNSRKDAETALFHHGTRRCGI